MREPKPFDGAKAAYEDAQTRLANLRLWGDGRVPKQCTFTEAGQQQDWTPFEEAHDDEAERLSRLVDRMGG